MGGKRVTTESFIERALLVHGDRYGYEKCVYSGSKENIIITCKNHGDFKQLPYNHLKGKGCMSCRLENASKKYMYSQDDAINLFKAAHGEKYDYYLVNYTGAKNKVKIICRDHGLFLQEANAHTVGKGCDLCARQTLNYKKSDYVDLCNKKYNGMSNLYVLEMEESDGSVFYKIGITVQKLKYRYRLKDMPYKYKILKLIKAKANKVFDAELEIKKILLNDTYSPAKKFAGSKYECFSHIPDNVYEIIDSLVS